MPRKSATFLLFILIMVSSAWGAGKAHPGPGSGIKFKILHNFTGGSDGGNIYAGLARKTDGTLFGVTYSDNGGSGDGVLFKLTPMGRRYKFSVVMNFDGGNGRLCRAAPTHDRSGNLFGVCTSGGSYEDWGTLWEYSRTGKFKVLHVFGGPADGMEPYDSVAVDGSGDIYGTAYTWGPGGSGTLWKYAPSSGKFTLLHSFADGDDGALLPAGPRVDENTGMIWGTTEFGPNCYYCGDGTVWNYDPSSDTFTTVLDFNSTGILAPQSRVTTGEDGDVFGTAFGTDGGYHNCGVVYELQKDKNYAPIVIHDFLSSLRDGCLPYGRLRWGQQGNLVGATYVGGDFGAGAVYELKRVNGRWQERILHSFNGNDGFRPQSGLVTDGKGNWFGTTAIGGKYGWGTVFEISGVR